VTEIAFHFNAPDKLAYCCRLLRKAVANGARVVVTGDTSHLHTLDALLWTFSPLEFVPHAWADPATAASLMAYSPVLLAPELASMTAELPHHQVLLNLADHPVTGFEAFERLIEVVSLDPTDRQGARSRWKHYAARGYPIVRHDLALKDTAHA
jgi:DNA polymerase III subunit chi